MPSWTSLMPSFWPASTIETLILLRCRQMRPQAGPSWLGVDYGRQLRRPPPPRRSSDLAPIALRSAGRYGITTDNRYGNTGFRIARTLSRTLDQ